MPSEPSRRSFVQAAGLLAAGAVAARAVGEDKSKEQPPLAPPDRQPADVALPDVPARKVGWAVVGLGKLAIEEIMPAFGSAKLSRPVALVSGAATRRARSAEREPGGTMHRTPRRVSLCIPHSSISTQRVPSAASE